MFEKKTELECLYKV